MQRYFKHRVDAVRCVDKVLRRIEDLSTLTIIIERGKLEGYFVDIATTELSDATPTESGSNEQAAI